MISQTELNKRIHNMHTLGILATDEVPTVWQIEQAGWIMQPGITRIRPSHEPNYGTWWAKMPQRLILQGLSGSGSKEGTGFARDTKSQIWHILTIHHFDINGFGYDLEMLSGHDHGLERMLSEVTAMLSGTHPQHWLAWQIIGIEEYWPRVKAATEQFLSGDFSFTGNRVQATVNLALSFPRTRLETISNPEAMRRHSDALLGILENGSDLVQYSLGLKKIADFPPGGMPEPTPSPLEN